VRLSVLGKDTNASIILILNAVKLFIFHFFLGQILLVYSLLKIIVYNIQNYLSSY